MATGKTINELPDIGQLTGGEMIPVSLHKQNKYTTGKTGVNFFNCDNKYIVAMY